jgi:uncharacterized damage-inducible protein DinB
MAMIDAMIEELKAESAATRALLELIPNDKLDWRPHPKSMTFRELGSHLAEMSSWTPPTIETDELTLDMDQYEPFAAEDVDQMLKAFDANLAAAIEAMQGQPDDRMMRTWTMKRPDGSVVFQMPRIAVLRLMVLNHAVHHRGQLSVYLRLNDIPLPSVYGPTADNPQF